MNPFSQNDKSHSIPQAYDESKRKFALKYNDPGNFVYEDDGFVFKFDKGPEKIRWTDIERLVAFKADLMTIDEIRMEIVYNNRQTTITEDTPGWYQFVERTKNIFAGIPEDWDSKITHPAFTTNLTVLYEREDRIMPKENNFYAGFTNIDKVEVKDALESNGWTTRKANRNDFEMTNSWTELILEGEDNSPLLNGIVSLHQKNIAILNNIFDSLSCQYTYEFYDQKKNLIYEKKNDS